MIKNWIRFKGRRRSINKSTDAGYNSTALQYAVIISTRLKTGNRILNPVKYAMPVRKIPLNRRVPTGYFYSDINRRLVGYESPVERDFYQTLEFDDTIEKYEEQPFAVENHTNGKENPLYPDCLVTYKPWTKKRPLLVEVKTEKELKDPKKAEEFRKRFKILRGYARKHNMNFRIVLDTEIRGPYLENLKFLYRYGREPDKLGMYREAILKTVRSRGAMKVSEILEALARDRKEHVHILPSIWHLLKTKDLKADLNKRLTNGSLLEVED